MLHNEIGQHLANPGSAGFQTCAPCLFNKGFEPLCAHLFSGLFASLSRSLPTVRANVGLLHGRRIVMSKRASIAYRKS
jgi:hypothetical protein